ncbi:hypothetical protein ES702_02872 [subsurface metagenome]
MSNDRDNKPYLTLYVRASGRSKLTPVLSSAATNDKPAARIRIVEGALADKSAVRAALSADGSFPKVTTVISVLGAYMTLWNLITRARPTPIADAINNTIIPLLLEMDIKRILLLSTPPAFPIFRETEKQSWGWYFFSWHPVLVVPEGHAEMQGIARTIMDNSSGQLTVKHGLQATVFRIPYFNDGSPDLEVRAFVIGEQGNTESRFLSRRSMARWLFRELEEKKWVGGAPVLCNPTE